MNNLTPEQIKNIYVADVDRRHSPEDVDASVRYLMATAEMPRLDFLNVIRMMTNVASIRGQKSTVAGLSFALAAIEKEWPE